MNYNKRKLQTLHETFLMLMYQHDLLKYSKILQYGTEVYIYSLRINPDRAEKARDNFIRSLRKRGLYLLLSGPILDIYQRGCDARKRAIQEGW